VFIVIVIVILIIVIHTICNPAGLLFARTLDPLMESPVPAAYAYKLMLFFIPTSGVKNCIILNLVASHGAGIALLVCLCVVCTWVLIFDTYFRNRFVFVTKGKAAAMLRDKRREGIADPKDSDATDTEPLMALSFDANDLEGEGVSVSVDDPSPGPGPGPAHGPARGREPQRRSRSSPTMTALQTGAGAGAASSPSRKHVSGGRS
jgi:hypothetical protein